MLKEWNVEKILKKALCRGGDFADIYFEDSTNTSIICEEDRIEKITSGRDVGIGVRVLHGDKTSYAYTNNLSEATILDLAENVSHAVKEGKEINVGAVKPTGPEGLPIEESPQEWSLKEKVALVERGNHTARGFGTNVRQVKVIYGDAFKRVTMANSEGEWADEERSSTLYLAQVVAEKNGVLQTGYEPIGGAQGMEIFRDDPPEKIAEIAADRALMMLKARKAPGGKMTVVLSSEAGGTMIHEAIGHGLEADLVQQGLSVYSGKMGETVASPLISVADDHTLPTKRGTSLFDDEATKARRTLLVEKGVLKNFMYDRLTALKDGVSSTGNGRRDSYRQKPIPRMTNTLILPGETDPQSIVASVDKGLLVKKMGGGQVNTVNGSFVFEITEGYLIEGGKAGEPVRGATLTGNGPEVLKMIDMVGSDLGFAIGTCGKDGQGAPVSDAQPTLRIPEIVVGGEVQNT